MTLDQLSVGQEAIVTDIDSGRELKRRLLSFGLVKGTKIKLTERTLKRNTFEVQVDRSMVALRKGEAQKVQVQI
ncbi:MAG: FeoA family protein [Campylobacterota bacterium]